MLKLHILWPRSLSSKIISWIRFLLARNLWAVIKILLITLDRCWPFSMNVSRSFITYLTDQLDTSNWANPCSFYCGRHVYSGALSFDFYYDFDLFLALKVKLWEHFSLEWVFPNFFQKNKGDFGQICDRKLYRQVAHDLIIVDLQLTYFRIYCVVRESSYSVTYVTWLENYKLNLVPVRGRPLSSVDNLPDHSWPLLTLCCK